MRRVLPISTAGPSLPYRYAKQATAAHVLFNLLGVLLFLAFLPLYKQVVIHTASDVGRQLANAHTIFNIVNTIL